MRQVVLDTETTGLYVDQGHRIIEIGCVEIIDRKITGNHYHCYINPQREIEAGAFTVHGITDQFLQDKPLFDHIAEELISFISGAELIIHNAPFDVGFLNYELKLIAHQCEEITKICRIVDSLALARQLHMGQRNSLDALCKRYFIDNSKRELHGALLDAHLLSRVYLAMTGGQSSLFGDLSAPVTQTQSAIDLETKAVIRNLPVIHATADELTQHHHYLQQMALSGKSLWSEIGKTVVNSQEQSAEIN